MPRGNSIIPSEGFTAEGKKALAERITKLFTAAKLPAFYVGVVFQEVAEDSLFIGGEPTGKQAT